MILFFLCLMTVTSVKNLSHGDWVGFQRLKTPGVPYRTLSNQMKQTLVRSIRDVSIVYSVGEMMINTLDHFNECANRVNSLEK